MPANDQLRDLERQLRSLGNAIGDTDTKMEVFLRALRVIYDDNPNGKVLVFSTFKRTLNYLRQQLLRRTSWIDGGVFLLTGDLAVADRPQVIERFRTATGFSVLLMSEVGAEGLDFQFTDVLFNYDLPWNPMRVEQRIGRIDRYGNSSRLFGYIRLFSKGPSKNEFSHASMIASAYSGNLSASWSQFLEISSATLLVAFSLQSYRMNNK